MQRFMLTRLEAVISGPGAIGAIGEELDQRGARRAVVITGASLGGSALLGKLTEALGHRCAGISTDAREHAPASSVRAMTAQLQALQADAIVSFGGGSAIDSAKVVAASLMNGRDMTREAGALELARAFDPLPGRGLPHIAVPTTLSAGAFTPAGGVTDEASLVKGAVLDPRVQPCVVVHDPQLCIETPDPLWISTGVRVLDHAVETIYARRAHPLSSALAVRAIRMILEHLPRSLGRDPDAVRHRGHCLDAAWLSLYGSFNTGLGLSHALGHQIGPAFHVPHGVTSCLCLAPAMRFMAGQVPERFADIAEGLRLPFDPSRAREHALACADAVERFVAGFDVPTSLRQLGVDLPQALSLSEAVIDELRLFDAVDRIPATSEVEALLRAIHGGT
jgi:alcohol dehydrogenase class IV